MIASVVEGMCTHALFSLMYWLAKLAKNTRFELFQEGLCLDVSVML
jgi:hypothetical protein